MNNFTLITRFVNSTFKEFVDVCIKTSFMFPVNRRILFRNSAFVCGKKWTSNTLFSYQGIFFCFSFLLKSGWNDKIVCIYKRKRPQLQYFSASWLFTKNVESFKICSYNTKTTISSQKYVATCK